jgi:hypothetical protein
MSGSGAYGRVQPGLSRHPDRLYRRAMTAKDDKAARLAEKLRENLRKRKAQAREQAGSETASRPTTDQTRSR